MVDQEPAAHILVVDDIPTNCILLEAHMKRVGFDVTSAGGGVEALQKINQKGDIPGMPPYDLVILDIMMPDITGIDVLKGIRMVYPPEVLPVIMATGKSTSEDIVEALSLGANDYVVKPIDMPVLLARMATQLKLSRTLKTLKRTQDSLLDAAKMESIGRIAAGVAHEVKNPLYVIQMGVDYFSMVLEPEHEQATKTLANMQVAIDRADSIIRGMLDFSRTQELKLELSDLNAVIQKSLVLLRHEINSRKVDLELQLEDGLPQVLLDHTKIEQVFINLITNACDAMENGGSLTIRSSRISSPSIPIHIMSMEERKLNDMQDGVMVEIIDDGPGIPHEHMPKLFDCFFTSKPAGKGTGLGLSVTKTIIDLHGGYIDISNNEIHGARACILLDAAGPKSVPKINKSDPVETVTKRVKLKPLPNSPHSSGL